MELLGRELGTHGADFGNVEPNPNRTRAWRLAALATLVFRSALTPEHAEGGWAGDGPFFEAPRLMAPAIRLRDDRRGARHWARIAHRKLHVSVVGVKRALHCLTESCFRRLIGLRAQPSRPFPSPSSYQLLTDVGPVELWATH